jgi:hypothetical protein
MQPFFFWFLAGSQIGCVWMSYVAHMAKHEFTVEKYAGEALYISFASGR